MKVIFFILTLTLSSSLTIKAQSLGDAWKKTKEAAKTNTTVTDAMDKAENAANAVTSKTSTPTLSNEEVIKGLKEALSIGTNASSSSASKLDGYLKNPKIYIPWPEEAKEMRAKVIKMGMQKKVTEFETSLNRAAEEAAKKSAPVFLNAITNMSIGDGFAILNGSDSSATNYLRKTTYAPLKEQFMPIVKEAINKVNVTSYWKPLATAYNKLPGVKKQNPDLDDYVCTKAINGLMVLIMEEEYKIRQDPMARVTDILKKVFGFKK